MGWSEFCIAFVVFFLSHSVPVHPPVRGALVGLLGQRGFTIGYSALSLAVLIWLIGAAERAPYVPLWQWAPWQNYVVLVGMGLACLLLALTSVRPNPFSFGGTGNDRFDPADPGIIRLHRHPLLLALALWAFAHVLPNGDVAHVILFGLFGSFALFGQKIIDGRKRRQMGSEWDTLWSQTRQAPLRFATLSPVRVCAAALLYGLLLWLHPRFFGVSPLP